MLVLFISQQQICLWQDITSTSNNRLQEAVLLMSLSQMLIIEPAALN